MRDRLNLDDTAPGVLDRVRPPRLGRPYSRTGKLCSAQLSPEATIPGISTIPCFAFELAASRESWEWVAIETLCSATLPLDLSCMCLPFMSLLGTFFWLVSVLGLCTPSAVSTPKMSSLPSLKVRCSCSQPWLSPRLREGFHLKGCSSLLPSVVEAHCFKLLVLIWKPFFRALRVSTMSFGSSLRTHEPLLAKQTSSINPKQCHSNIVLNQ